MHQKFYQVTSGLKISELLEGTGDQVERGSSVSIHFRCFLNRGEQVSSSYEGQPQQFVVGKRQMIAGLERGVIGMRVGGRREIVISPHLGYRERGAPGIPANAVIRFEVELIELNTGGCSED